MRALALSMLRRPGTALPGALHPVAWLIRALKIRRERAALERLDAERLDDIGLSRGAAWSEGRRPFWELPDNRRW